MTCNPLLTDCCSHLLSIRDGTQIIYPAHIFKDIFLKCTIVISILSSSYVIYNPLWFSSAGTACLSSCWLLIMSCSWQANAVEGACESCLTHCPFSFSSLSGCRPCCGGVTSVESVSFPCSSLPSVFVSKFCEPLSRQTCLRMVRRFLLRRDWSQCRVRLRCHWLRECWASTLSCRAGRRGRKLLM